MNQSETSEQPYIPIPVIRYILAHRRRRLAALAEKQKAATSQVSEATDVAVGNTDSAEQNRESEDNINDNK